MNIHDILFLGPLVIRYQLADWRIRPLPQEMIKYSTEPGSLLIEICDARL